jgi:hypothetical protein
MLRVRSTGFGAFLQFGEFSGFGSAVAAVSRFNRTRTRA